MLAIGGISFAMGIVFLSLGAWPVFGFFGLDVLLIYIAFRLNYRSGRAYELIELTPALLTLTRVAPSGRQQSFEFNPYWVRVHFSERPDGRTHLRLASHGRELEFAHCLNDDERREFARVLEDALAVARATPDPLPG
jgi:uncharacterized membrane protein